MHACSAQATLASKLTTNRRVMWPCNITITQLNLSHFCLTGISLEGLFSSYYFYTGSILHFTLGGFFSEGLIFKFSRESALTGILWY